jgi:hypothetical protein
MALLLLPVLLIILLVAAVVLAVIEVVRHGLVVKVRYPGAKLVRHSTKRVVMWWLLSTAVPLLLMIVLDSMAMFFVTLIVFLAGGFGVVLHIGGNPPFDQYVG